MQKRMIYRQLRAEKRSGGDGKEECPYSLYILYARARKDVCCKTYGSQGEKAGRGEKGRKNAQGG